GAPSRLLIMLPGIATDENAQDLFSAVSADPPSLAGNLKRERRSVAAYRRSWQVWSCVRYTDDGHGDLPARSPSRAVPVSATRAERQRFRSGMVSTRVTEPLAGAVA